MRTETPVHRNWGKPNIRLPRLDGNKLWLPRSVREDAGYIDLDTHKVVYNEGVEEYGRIGLELLFKELTNIK
jgi:hypothetical protein